VICEGLKTVLFVSPSDPSITYTWTTPSKTTVINDSVILDKVKLSDAGTYTVTATKNNCTSPEVYSKLTVDTAAIHEKAIVTNNRICEGDTVTIDAAHYIPGVSYVIYTQANGGTPVGVAPLKVFPTQTTIYYMEAKSAKGCSQLTERDTVTVYVYKAPFVPPPIASDMTICEGKTTIINVQGPVPGNTYNVYDALTGGKLLGKTPLTVTLTKTTTLYVEAVSTQGCKQVKGRLPITIKVNPTPQGPKITVENITGNYICDGLSAKLISSITSGIIWSTGETTASIVVKKAGTYWVYYTDANGCASLKDSVNITIKTPPKVDASNFVVDTVRCNATIGGIHGITISSGTAPYTYKWFETTDPSKILSTDLVLQGVPSGKYTLIVTDKNGCEDRLSNVYIPSKGGIVAHLTGTPLAGYEPLNIDLTTNTSGVGKPIDYVWVLDGHILGTTDSKTNTFSVKNLKFGEHVMAVTVRDTNGCKSVDYLKIFVDIPVIIHDVNIFTPNNDGHNDILIFPQQGVQTMHVKIYDRWGLKLYEWNDPDKGWDGKTESGGEAPEGTYYYIIEYVDFYSNSHRTAGYVQLMR
jgi:gliding motility-associated-like protein